jgi:rhodanese-related sulfurtransferase
MNTDTPKEITANSLFDQIKSNQEIVIIDTLPNDHFQKVHLPTAKNACVFEVTFLDQIASIHSDRSTPIVLYGASESTMDAATAAAKIGRAGYEQVRILQGGLSQWREQGLPLEGDAPQQSEEQSTIPALQNRTYPIDIHQSIIEWIGRNPNTKHDGNIKLSAGSITIENGNISGKFDIDMRSVKNYSLKGDELQPVLISHLLSDDFFFVERFPAATFTLNRAEQIEDPTLTAPNYNIHGVLELTGVKANLDFPATVTVLPDGKLTAEAHFDIDKTKWNIIYGSSRFFEHLGMHVVFDLISIQLKIVTS